MPDRLKPALPFLYALCLCALLSLVVAGRAEAHAALLASDPLDGAQLSLQPAAVELRFNEPVRPLMLRVLDRKGTTIASLAAGAPVTQSLRVTLPAGGDGVYLASWRVASADDHPVAGSLSWRVGTAGADTGAPVAIAAGAVSPPLVLRLLAELTLLIAAGGALALPWLRPEGKARLRSVRVVRVAARLGLALLLPRLLAEGAALAGTSDWFEDETYAALAHTAYPLAAALALPGLLVLACLPKTGEWKRGWLLAGAVPALLSFGVGGHAVHALTGGWLAPVLVVHAVAAAIWLGALWPTEYALRSVDPKIDDQRPALAVLGRFAHRGRELLGALAVSGLLIACVQLGPPSPAWGNTYARLFMAKLGLAFLLFALGALNRWCWLPALARGRRRAASRLRLSVRLCRGLLVAVVALSVALGTTMPPRAGAGAVAPPPAALVERHWPSAYGPRLGLNVAMQAGRPAATLSVTGPDDQPFTIREAVLVLERPEAGIEPLRRRLDEQAPGRYGNDDLLLPLAGPWQGYVEIWIDDFSLERQPLAFTLP